MQHSTEVSIIFLKMFDDSIVRNLERQKDIDCVDLFVVSFTNIKGIQDLYTKFQEFKQPK